MEVKYLIKLPDGVRILSNAIKAYWYNEESNETFIDTGADNVYYAAGDQTKELDKLMRNTGCCSPVSLHAPEGQDKTGEMNE